MSSPGLVRSGWWVLVAAVVLSVAVLAAWLMAPRDTLPQPAVDGISFEPCLVERDEIVRAMARDGLVALTDPAVMSPEEIDLANEAERGKLLVPDDLVVGVELGGEARAYPLRLLRWHEAVNDSLGGRAISVTSSPLAGSVAVWDRDLGDLTVELAVSGMLLDSTSLLYDRHQGLGAASLWHQLSGEAVAGPAAGRRLAPLPASLATWGSWRRDHPDTTVLAPDPDSKQLYKRDPYHSYRGSEVLRFPVDPLPPAGPLGVKDRVAVVTSGGVDTAFALPLLAAAVGTPRGTWTAEIDHGIVLVRFDAVTGAISVSPHDPAAPAPPVRYASWFAWYALHPGAVAYP